MERGHQHPTYRQANVSSFKIFVFDKQVFKMWNIWEGLFEQAVPKSKHCQEALIKGQKERFNRCYLLLKVNPFQTERPADGKEAGH